MRSTFAVLALAAVAAAVPAGVSSAVAPASSAPAGCSSSYDGTFEIQVVNVNTKRELSERNTPLVMTLKNGVLMDSQGRTGYIASNQQFQFDDPPQAGAVYTSGFSVCSNGSLAIGADAVWYKCLSGTFYNLYDTSDAGQCSEVYILVAGGGVPATSAYGPASSAAAPSSVPASSAAPSSSAASSYVVVSSAASVVASQIPDGQVTAMTVPVTQISDGQIQAPTSAPVPVCSEYVDGQPQCASSAPAPPVCSEYVDGQPQCAASTGYLPSYYAPSGTGVAPVPSYTGPAIASGPAAMATPVAALLAGAFGIAAML